MTENDLKRVKKDLLEDLLVKSPQDARDLIKHIDQLQSNLRRALELLSDHYRHAEIDPEMLRVKKFVEKACQLLGARGKKIAARFGA